VTIVFYGVKITTELACVVLVPLFDKEVYLIHSLLIILTCFVKYIM